MEIRDFLVSRQKLKEILVWTYIGVLPFFVFLAYYLGRSGILDFWEKVLLILVVYAHIVLHNYMIIQFVKLIEGDRR